MRPRLPNLSIQGKKEELDCFAEVLDIKRVGRQPILDIQKVSGIKKPAVYRCFFFIMVPRDRIELPTRGFSVPCSTD